MKFLLDKLDKQRTDADGADIYTDGELTLRVDAKAGRAIVQSAAGEATLIRDPHGRWVPEHHNWRLLAKVLGAPELAAATVGF